MARFQVIKGGEALGMGLADYLWVTEEGAVCVKKKTILIGKDDKGGQVPLVDRWSVAECGCCEDVRDHDMCPRPMIFTLSPCFFLPDPTRPQPNYLVLCEIRDTSDKCPLGSYRSLLRKAQKARGPTAKLMWFGFEQKYMLWDADEKEPSLNERRFLTSERHIGACFDAGLLLHSAWNQVPTRSWNFKVGVRGFSQDLDPDPPSALVVCDHLMVAHYLMEKIGSERGLVPEWRNLALFVSTPKLREPGGDQEAQMAHLMEVLQGDDRRLRGLPHPVRGGDQCIEVARSGFMNPYKLALDVLEALWPLEAK